VGADDDVKEISGAEMQLIGLARLGASISFISSGQTTKSSGQTTMSPGQIDDRSARLADVSRLNTRRRERRRPTPPPRRSANDPAPVDS
jgi:hypothetical protein